jgi:hypothetical protein
VVTAVASARKAAAAMHRRLIAMRERVEKVPST